MKAFLYEVFFSAFFLCKSQFVCKFLKVFTKKFFFLYESYIVRKLLIADFNLSESYFVWKLLLKNIFCTKASLSGSFLIKYKFFVWKLFRMKASHYGLSV